ncbi:MULTISPECIES: hypothetical protein [unclassified Mesorhizobium]|uniref:hypothetical protein n=1 Tax=unclassified Mesorhizobium TaxID=325217 RepID=UPI000404F51E|nr:hypothetical protein [Mesorhizobium sp. L2C084A000]
MLLDGVVEQIIASKPLSVSAACRVGEAIELSPMCESALRTPSSTANADAVGKHGQAVDSLPYRGPTAQEELISGDGP